MQSPLPKVLHPVAGRPMLSHVLATARGLSPSAIHVVVGHGAEAVREAVAQPDLNWVLQAERLGTGHAVSQALPDIAEGAVVLVLYGDVPLIRAETLASLVEAAHNTPALLTARLQDPSGYGRVLRDAEGKLLGVVEDRDAKGNERSINEINTGVLAAPAADLKEYLPQVGNDNDQGEYYLPDVLGLAVAAGRAPASFAAQSALETLGVNDRLQLHQVEREYQRRQAEALLLAGVSVADAGRLDIRGELTCGENVVIDVNVVIEGHVSLGDGAHVGPNCVLINSHVGAGASIHATSHLEGAVVGPGCSIGPFARLRPGTRLAEGARIGNFVETKNVQMGAGSKASHLSYLGDSQLGSGVNIGAGTITCNYDGVNKHQTIIGDGVFVGSNSTLVAPLEIGAESFVAAGTTATKPVGDKELAVGRSRQRNIQGWQRPNKDEH